MTVRAIAEALARSIAVAVIGGNNPPGSGDPGGGSSNVLENGVPVMVSNDGSEGHLVYTYTLPSGVTNHVVTLTDGGSFTGTAPGLYLRFNAEPLLPGEGATWTCRSLTALPESCNSATHGNNSAGTWYVKLPQATYSGALLEVEWTV